MNIPPAPVPPARSAPTFSPYDYAVHEDPYPVYERLREEAPLYRNDELDFWAISRHSDVAAAFRDHERFSNINGVTLDPSAWSPTAHQVMSFLALDPPDHTRMRSLVSKGFTPRRVRDLTGDILRLTRKYLDPAVAEGEFDAITDFAGRLPMDVISEMVGVPEPDRGELRRLADLVVHREPGINDVPPAGMEAALTLVAYYEDMVAERRRRPAADLTSALLAARLDDGDRLTDREVIAFLFLMVVAGNETTTKLIANALYWGRRHFAQLTRLFAEPIAEESFLDPSTGAFTSPDRVTDWVEETLRFDTSSQMIARTVARDTEFHGTTLRAGDRLLLLIGAANHDPRVFPDPEAYDLDRDTSQLISFGAGRHFCLGANLARLEAQIALAEFVRRVRSYDVHEDRAVRVHSSNVRGFAELPIKVEAR